MPLIKNRFNGHPPLGVNATWRHRRSMHALRVVRFNGHPPLGVNATKKWISSESICARPMFQWAPTLGGECYDKHGVEATVARLRKVSMGTHPWG